ncbi:MAG: xanthine dehydrogenase molybdopterin binding subunit [Bacteroidota bacterium]
MKQTPHESAWLHVTGEAVYVDDMPAIERLLVGRVVYSPEAHARIQSVDLAAARAVPGVHAVLSAADIPGANQMGPVVHDEPCLADGEVMFVGQAVFLIAAETEQQCREAERLIQISYDPLEAILSIEAAMAKNSMLGAQRTMSRGSVDEALKTAPHRLSGELRTGAQEHWYLESQVSLCVPGECREMHVYSSTQNPSETQSLVAGVLGMPKNEVIVEVRRIGGGFGGKETQANHVACWTALLCRATGRPVKIRLFRDDDMIMTGKRHRFLSRYEVGFDGDGRLLAAKFELNSDAGAATDLSHAVMERAMLHSDSAYYVPNMTVMSRVWRTNLPSNTACRGFGGPQGMALMETVIDRIARTLKKDAADVRMLNFYGTEDRNVTHYGQTVENNRLHMIHDKVITSADYRKRRREIDVYNAMHEFQKKGLALTPVKFGISFTTTFLNQAGALVVVYDDGTVLLNHGGTEMGQGLHTKIRQIAAAEFGVSVDMVKLTPTNTSKVPNSPPTAASTGTDLNGAAVKNAIEKLKRRIADGVSAVFNEKDSSVQTDTNDIVFCDNWILDSRHPDRRMDFREAVRLMRLRQVSLSATGFYRTPGIGWDKMKGVGRPFHYYAFGMAVSEVLVDILTGSVDLLRTDILHDVGDSVNPGIDVGQTCGAFVQGLGWVTTEDIKWDVRGNLLTHSPDTYKIPTANDIPKDFRVSLLKDVPNPTVVGRSKAVGEPPLMLALSVWLAIKDAISSVDNHEAEPEYSLPATNEVILLSVDRLRKKRQTTATGSKVT